jgi:hypothetical protein
MIAEFNLEDVVTLVAPVPVSEAYSIIAGSDALLLTLGFRECSRYVVPAKLYDYLAIGRPVIAFVPEGEASSLLADRTVHGVISRDDPAAVAPIMDRLYSNWQRGQSRMGVASLNVDAWPRFWRSHLARRLRDLLGEIVASPARRRSFKDYVFLC